MCVGLCCFSYVGATLGCGCGSLVLLIGAGVYLSYVGYVGGRERGTSERYCRYVFTPSGYFICLADLVFSLNLGHTRGIVCSYVINNYY